MSFRRGLRRCSSLLGSLHGLSLSGRRLSSSLSDSLSSRLKLCLHTLDIFLSRFLHSIERLLHVLSSGLRSLYRAAERRLHTG